MNKLYGFTVKGKSYDGLLDEVKGQKVGKSNVVISVEHKEKFIALFKKYKVNAKQMEIFVNE